jgi:hypothetical protein
VIQPVLSLHQCAESAAAKCAAEPLHSNSRFATIESATEPLQYVAHPVAASVARTETS